jgi:hypothetical protein
VEFIVEVRCIVVRVGEANAEARFVCSRRAEVSIGVRCIGIRAVEANIGVRCIGIRAIEARCPLICAVAVETAKTQGTTQLQRINFFQFITLWVSKN